MRVPTPDPYKRLLDGARVMAVRWDGPRAPHPALVRVVITPGGGVDPTRTARGRLAHAIETRYGWSEVSPGDWIVETDVGAYRCPDDKFEGRYEPIHP